MKFDLKEITTAWISRIKPTENQKKLATLRAKICEVCPNLGEPVGGKKVANYCKVCGCLLGAKVYSYKEGACPEGRWNELDKTFNNTEALKVLKHPKTLV